MTRIITIPALAVATMFTILFAVAIAIITSPLAWLCAVALYAIYEFSEH
jgi:hypothetical protein